MQRIRRHVSESYVVHTGTTWLSWPMAVNCGLIHITAPLLRGVEDLSNRGKVLVSSMRVFAVFFISMGFRTPPCSSTRLILLASLSR